MPKRSPVADDSNESEASKKRREIYRRKIACETPEAKAARLEKARNYQRQRRSHESADEIAQRRAENAAREAQRRANEGAEEHARRRAENAARDAQRRANESAEEHARRRAENAARDAQRRASETTEQATQRRAEDTARHAAARAQMQFASGTKAALSITNEDTVPEHYLGPMNVLCEFCQALHFATEKLATGKFKNCCHSEAVAPAPQRKCPPRLRELLSGMDRVNSRNFLENIRSYNSSLAFGSMEAKLSPPSGHGPYCYRIHDQIYHYIGNLHPSANEPPSYGQLYIIDAAQAAAERSGHPANSRCNSSLLAELADIISNCNPYAKSFRMMRDVEQNAPQATDVMMIFDINLHSDMRRYNAPTAMNEVAAVFVGERYSVSH